MYIWELEYDIKLRWSIITNTTTRYTCSGQTPKRDYNIEVNRYRSTSLICDLKHKGAHVSFEVEHKMFLRGEPVGHNCPRPSKIILGLDCFLLITVGCLTIRLIYNCGFFLKLIKLISLNIEYILFTNCCSTTISIGRIVLWDCENNGNKFISVVYVSFITSWDEKEGLDVFSDIMML